MKDIKCPKKKRNNFMNSVIDDSMRQADLQCLKYEKGEKEHGMDWPGILGLLGHAREEVADLSNYILMLEHTIKNYILNKK